MARLHWTTLDSYEASPTTTGVYRYLQGDTILYIGKAVNLRARLASHAQMAKLDERERQITSLSDRIEITEVDTEFKALLLEAELIRKYKPQYNRAWKDDKSYLYITIDLTTPFPKPHFARAHDLPRTSQQDLRIFGPFPNSHSAEELLRSIRRLIPFCQQKRVGERACFYSKLGLCNPCPSTVHKLTGTKNEEAARQYRRQIRQVIRILEGRLEPVIKDIKRQISTYSQNEEYEQALALRNKIMQFKRYTETQVMSSSDLAYNTSGDKLEALRTLLDPHLGNLADLSRIECYDASHSALLHSTVALTVATDGLLDRGEYRRFRVKNPRAHSDLARLSEVLTRRFLHLGRESWQLPSLIIIDGGLPQVRQVQKITDTLPLSIPFLGLAKRPDRLVLPSGVTIRPGADNPGFQLLQSLRDEAHRFANNYRKILDKRLSFNG